MMMMFHFYDDLVLGRVSRADCNGKKTTLRSEEWLDDSRFIQKEFTIEIPIHHQDNMKRVECAFACEDNIPSGLLGTRFSFLHCIW